MFAVLFARQTIDIPQVSLSCQFSSPLPSSSSSSSSTLLAKVNKILPKIISQPRLFNFLVMMSPVGWKRPLIKYI